jgi:hypothetical protein
MLGAKKERVALCAGAYHKNVENGQCQKRESHSLRRRITQKQGKWLVAKLRESLTVQAHNIKTRKTVGGEFERVTLCAGAYHKNKEKGCCPKRESHSLRSRIT